MTTEGRSLAVPSLFPAWMSQAGKFAAVGAANTALDLILYLAL